MTTNIFEGGRRIAKLVGVLWIFFAGWLAIEDWKHDVAVMPAELQYLRFVGFIWLPIGLAVLWALTWTVGWIVRGFLGIPHGQDRKPATPET
jgi:hypothetical protein